MPANCPHLREIKFEEPASHACAQCVALGDTWVHLRMCMSCGLVACCDNSKNRHASRHFRESNHPVIRSIEPGERWRWCFVDQLFME